MSRHINSRGFCEGVLLFKGYEVLLAVHTDTAHTHVHFLVSNCNVKDGKSFRRGPAELKEMCRYFGEQCRKRGLVHSYRDSYYVKDKDRERQSFAEYQMKSVISCRFGKK